MTTLHMGSKTWVVLNSNRVVAEIIAKRGSITHERPYFPVASGLVSRDKRSVIRKTQLWTEGRRVMHHLLNGSSLKAYERVQEEESVGLLAAYLYRPHRWYSHHYRYSSSVMHRIILGEPLIKSTPELEDLQRVSREFLLSINASIVDFYPRLASMPKFLQPGRNFYSKMGQFHYDVFRRWWTPVTTAIAKGTAPPSFARDVLLHEETKFTGSDEDAMYLSLSIISAGSDNTRAAMNVFVMSALCYPNAVKRVREEADALSPGVARLPYVDDMPKMPYTCAFVKEVLRWRPSVPLVPQHQLTQDLDFDGYHFPAETEFLINNVAVSADFDMSEKFQPERWLDGNESNVSHGLWVFGGGRRVCVGYKLAQTELFLAFARLAFCFDYSPVSSDVVGIGL